MTARTPARLLLAAAAGVLLAAAGYLAYAALTIGSGLLRLAEILTHNGG